MSLFELTIPNASRGYGGAIAVTESGLVLGQADGTFSLIDLTTEEVTDNFLPAIEMGSNSITQSKSISYQETLPRIHDLLFHEGQFYTSFDRYDPASDAIYFVISRLNLNDRLWKDIYVSPPLESSLFTLGSGGALALDPKSRWLYFSIGDQSLDRYQGLPSDFAAQQDGLPWGHIMRLNITTLKTQTFAKGVRNPLGLLFLDGNLYSSEMGPRGGDELNLITQGSNYGWPFESLGTYYETFDRYSFPPGVTQTENFKKPIYSWLTGVAPSQMILISGFHDSWMGNVVMGSLKAESIFNFRIHEGRVLYMEQIPVGARIRDLVEDKGQVVLLTDTPSILVLRPKTRS
jgi:hypothetical protein